MQVSPIFSSETTLRHQAPTKPLSTTQGFVAKALSNNLFLPLGAKLSPSLQNLLQKEINFYQDFCDPLKPLNPHMPHHGDILTHFSCSKQTFCIEFQGKPLNVTCSFIESKNTEPKSNYVCVQGNLSTLENNISTLYPFLASYCKQVKQSSTLPGLRVISISQYDTKTSDNRTFVPHNAKEAGEILSRVLEKIHEVTGPLSLLTAHSIGTVIFAAALPYLTHEASVLPPCIYLDRGPSSFQEGSRHMGLCGKALFRLASFAGWDIDVGKAIQSLKTQHPHIDLTLSETLQDHHFAKYSLLKSHHLKPLIDQKQIKALSFDFPAQMYSSKSHHNLHNGLLDGYHLVPRDPSILKSHETVADQLMKTAIKPLKQASPFSYLWQSLFRRL